MPPYARLLPLLLLPLLGACDRAQRLCDVGTEATTWADRALPALDAAAPLTPTDWQTRYAIARAIYDTVGRGVLLAACDAKNGVPQPPPEDVEEATGAAAELVALHDEIAAPAPPEGVAPPPAVMRSGSAGVTLSGYAPPPDLRQKLEAMQAEAAKRVKKPK